MDRIELCEESLRVAADGDKALCQPLFYYVGILKLFLYEEGVSP